MPILGTPRGLPDQKLWGGVPGPHVQTGLAGGSDPHRSLRASIVERCLCREEQSREDVEDFILGKSGKYHPRFFSLPKVVPTE